MGNNRRFRGIRAPIDSGYILGRTDKGRGDVHPIKLNDLAIALNNQPNGGGGSGLSPIDDGEVLANVSGVSANPTGTSVSALLDHVISNAQGSLLVRTATGWEALAPGTANKVLTANGASADLTWNTPTAVPTAANPTATASDTAVNGSAATFMRSDAAPAVQKASSSQFGVVKVDGTTITSSGGVIAAVGQTVSFEAYLSATTSAVTGDGTTYALINDTVISNVGSGYNSSTGVFTAPVAGDYIFTAGVRLLGVTSSNTYGFAQFQTSGGTGLARTWEGNLANEFGTISGINAVQTGGAVILRLAAGDTVQPAARASNNASKNVSIGGGSVAFTSFAGALIQPVGGGGQSAASNNLAGSPTTGPFATKGVMIQPIQNIKISKAWFAADETNGNSYQCSLVQLDAVGSSPTITAVLAQSSVFTASATASKVSRIYDLGGSFTLTAGNVYALILTQTNTATPNDSELYAGTDDANGVPLAQIDRYVRVNNHAPGIGTVLSSSTNPYYHGYFWSL